MNSRPDISRITTKTAGSLVQAIAFGAAALAWATPDGASATQPGLVRQSPPASIAATKACTSPYTPPKITAGLTVEMPAIADEQGITSGESVVEIGLSPKGDLISATIEKSSGNRWLDAAALRNARNTLFTPATTNCEPVGGTYLYVVDF